MVGVTKHRLFTVGAVLLLLVLEIAAARCPPVMGRAHRRRPISATYTAGGLLLGTFGTVPSNLQRRPGYTNLDPGVLKNSQLREERTCIPSLSSPTQTQSWSRRYSARTRVVSANHAGRIQGLIFDRAKGTSPVGGAAAPFRGTDRHEDRPDVIASDAIRPFFRRQ